MGSLFPRGWRAFYFAAVTEWKLGVVKSYSEADDFHFIEFPCEIKEGESISQNDLLLLSKEKVLMIRDCVFLDFEGPAMMYFYCFLHSYASCCCTILPWIVWIIHLFKLTVFPFLPLNTHYWAVSGWQKITYCVCICFGGTHAQIFWNKTCPS